MYLQDKVVSRPVPDMKQYDLVSRKLDDYQIDVLRVYQSLHAVLNGLQTAWRGWHVLLLLYLCEYMLLDNSCLAADRQSESRYG